MLSYDAGPTDTPILEETIGANFERTVAAHPDTLALVDRGQGLRYTYAELNAEVDLIARGLMARGVDKGDRVGVWSPNCAQWIVTQLATAKIGAILVNVNPAYRVHELAYALNQSGMRVLVSATSFKTSDYAAMIDDVRPQVPSLSDVVFLDGTDWDRLRADSAAVGADDGERAGGADLAA